MISRADALGHRTHFSTEEQAQWRVVHDRSHRFIFFDYFFIVNELPLFPKPMWFLRNVTATTDYYCTGGLRPNDNYCVFQFTLGGRGICRYRGIEYEAGPGSGFLYRPNDPEFAYWYPGESLVPWEMLSFSFWDKVSAPGMVDALIGRHGPVFELGSDHPFILGLLDRHMRRDTALTLKPAEGALLVADLMRSCEESAGEQPVARGSLADQVDRAIQTAEGTSLSTSALARILGVSREHLSRTYRSSTGRSLHAVKQSRKMAIGAEMLTRTRLPIKTIAARLGYYDGAAFCRAFEREMKKSPHRYRIDHS